MCLCLCVFCMRCPCALCVVYCVILYGLFVLCRCVCMCVSNMFVRFVCDVLCDVLCDVVLFAFCVLFVANVSVCLMCVFCVWFIVRRCLACLFCDVLPRVCVL